MLGQSEIVLSTDWVGEVGRGELAATFDLATFLVSMIAPVEVFYSVSVASGGFLNISVD